MTPCKHSLLLLLMSSFFLSNIPSAHCRREPSQMLLLHLGEAKPPRLTPHRCAGAPDPTKPAVHLELRCRWETGPEASCAPRLETKTRPVANYGRNSSAGFPHARRGESGGVGHVGFCGVNRSLPGILGEVSSHRGSGICEGLKGWMWDSFAG